MPDIHIFRAGTHTSSSGEPVTITERDIAASAAAYNPRVHEAPIVVGHPATNAPAYGWVQSLAAIGADLTAKAGQVNADFAELVRKGSFKKVSASFFLPNSAANPIPGVHYLRHVGFLGAAPPAVKGLRPAEFAGAGDGVVSFDDGTVDLREWSLAERERVLRQREDEAFVGDMLRQARFPSGLKDGVLSFMESLSDNGVVAFSDMGEPATAGQREWFRRFVTSLPPMLAFGEFAPENKATPDEADFAAPQGYSVDPSGADLHRAATAYQKANKCDYATAVRAVSRGSR